MLKLLIVDDEVIVRQGLRQVVDWKALDVQVIGEAGTVASAITLCERAKPDIVLCDIRLPGGTGFQIVEAAKKTTPWIQFIMLSAYSTKEYMQTAIHNNVCEYLFKPAKIADIEAAIRHAAANVSEYHGRMEREQSYLDLINNNLAVLRQSLLESILNQSVDWDNIQVDAKKLGLAFDGPFYRVAHIKHTEKEVFESTQSISASLSAYAVTIGAVWTKDCTMYVLLNCPNEGNTAALRQALCAAVQTEAHLSPACPSLPDVSPFFVAGHGENEAWAVQTGFTERLYECAAALLEAAKYREPRSKLLEHFDAFLDVAENGLLLFRTVQDEYIHIVKTISLMLDLPIVNYNYVSNLVEMRAQFREFLLSADESKFQRDVDVSQKALYLVKKDCCGALTLSQIASELFISEAYLSKLIKDRTGHGFRYWLNFYRIEAAKELLKKADYSVEQVALLSGYNSYRVFSKNFTQFTGVTATKFRAKHCRC